MNPDRKNIEARAYDLYRERNGKGGNKVDDWLKAEKNAKKENAQLAEFQATHYKKKPKNGPAASQTSRDG